MQPIRIALATAATLLVSACATTGATTDDTMDSAAARPSLLPTASARPDYNAQYIAQVESVARRRGILVQWVNAPSRRAP